MLCDNRKVTSSQESFNSSHPVALLTSAGLSSLVPASHERWQELKRPGKWVNDLKWTVADS